MRERPILFSGPMVRAILDGRKTVTRRLVKSSPAHCVPMKGRDGQSDGTFFVSRPDSDRVGNGGVLCPYGRPGDRLWVRETWAPAHPEYHTEADGLRLGDRPVHPDGRWCWYRATDGEVESGDDEDNLVRWRPSIHMPRWASRITLEVTGVRVERLQDISEEDARAEGAVFVDHGKGQWGQQLPGWHMDPSEAAKSWEHCLGTARFAFANLWNRINGAESWDANPWVWVVEFRRAS